jgi:hypothetical protein
MFNALQSLLRPIQPRQRLQRTLGAVTLGLLLGSAPGCLLISAGEDGSPPPPPMP